ncbi:hypothetical protein QB607_003130 [Clostridium botulinum]|nr:hypothetical protein [Clostridium botulinum]EKS4395803.1 hypothetical protein [Clostridium botulinum]
MKKVFLDDLPKWESGHNKGRINWIKSVGSIIKFIYDDLKGEVKIIEYDKQKNMLTLSYKNIHNANIRTGDFKMCRIGNLIGKKSHRFKVDIESIIKDNKRNLSIKNRYRKKDKNNISRKYYKYKCNKCGWEGEIEEFNLLKGRGCSVCCIPPQITVLGINTIWDTDRWMCDLGISEEDAKKHTHSSNQKIKVKCPYCGNSKNIIVNGIYKNKSISCFCGDGFSYPEKFIYELLQQLNIEVITQLNKTTFSWCNNKIYDFYIPSLNIIIETHGLQHYEKQSKHSTFNIILKDEQENDKLKEQLAKENRIKHYIVIDCRESELEFIKNNILKSKLNELFDLSKIDWNKCEEYALKNIIKEVCDYWNKSNETTTTLSKKFNISKKTIKEYLKKGNKLGWCEYNPKEEMRKSAIKCNRNKCKQIEIINKNGDILGIFESCNDLERKSEELFGIKLNNNNISAVCRGEQKTHKGFIFKYI